MRPITALFADIVGSTSLGERLGPDEVKALVGECVSRMARAVEEVGGTIQAGDGICAYMIQGSEALDFSTPAHEPLPASGFDAGASLVLVRNPSWERSTDPLRSALADRIEIVMGFGAFSGTSRDGR